MTSGRTHDHPIRIYFDDTDAGGVVYHSNYLTHGRSSARVEAMRDSGVPHAEMMTRPWMHVHGASHQSGVSPPRPTRRSGHRRDLWRWPPHAVTLTLSQIVRLGGSGPGPAGSRRWSASRSASQKPVRIPAAFPRRHDGLTQEF